jgi:hypothetical protein
MARGWEEWEYEELFRDDPPTSPTAPDAATCERLARRLDRSTGAVRAQWQDARTMVLGTEGPGSEQLRSYLGRRGWA